MHPEAFFNGKLNAYGVVKNRQGHVIRTFKADINAYWQDSMGVLEEDFIFDDGEKQHRRWELHKQDNSTYIATANDVVGSHQMLIVGNALFMDYLLEINFNNKPLLVKVVDRMFLVNDGHIMNESKFYKWGIHVGSVQLVIEKH